MELPHKPYGKIDPPIKDPSFQLLFDERPVRGYRMTLVAGKSLHLKGSQTPVVVIRVDDGNEVKVHNTALAEKRGLCVYPCRIAPGFSE